MPEAAQFIIRHRRMVYFADQAVRESLSRPSHGLAVRCPVRRPSAGFARPIPSGTHRCHVSARRGGTPRRCIFRENGGNDGLQDHLRTREGALQSLKGPEFDKAYWQHQALSHHSALVVEQAYAANGDDPAVRRAAASAVPMIQAHLTAAEEAKARSGS